MLKQQKIGLVFVGLLLLLAAFYYPAIHFEYVWDDTLLFVGKTSLLTQPLSWQLISEPVLPGTTYFRPLVFLSWYLEFNWLGQSATTSHIIGLIIFYINCCLVAVLAYILAAKFKPQHAARWALFAGGFYLLHPALIESSAWVSGRFDQLCTLFSLLASVLLVKAQLQQQRIGFLSVFLISVCVMCALLSKELGLVLPAILLVLSFALYQQTENLSFVATLKRCLLEQKVLWLSLMVVLVVYFALRAHAMSSMYHASMTADYIQNTIIKDWLPLHTLLFYLQQTFIPFSSTNILHPLDDWNFTGAIERVKAIMAGLFVLWTFWQAVCKKSLAAWLSIAALLSIALVLNFIPMATSGNIGHERFMTLGIAFVAVALVLVPYARFAVYLKIQAHTQKVLAALILVGWFAMCALTLKSIVPLWQSDYTLWSWTYKLHPNAAIARYNYLYGALEKRQFQEVIDEAEKYSAKHNGLEVADQLAYATALLYLGKEEGLHYFEGAIYALPKFHELQTDNARRQADYFLLTANQIAGAYNSYAMGQFLINGDLQKAKQYLEIAEWYLHEDQKEVLNYQKAALLFASGEYEEALRLYNAHKVISSKIQSDSHTLMAQTLRTYCEKHADKQDVCSNFEEKAILMM
ncbi:glucosyltransferase domain-containing protein [Acinetobacter towneri]|uniref:glucosyltransferase domain-containing protein n=1 Tax=Acinetobacter towneri TaxID=202956 RepID=UPI0020978463|nr:glucosyltransferase domain-containing protein [Acinetobacter towneri]MCO8059721.1 glucosyltransferase domain-containing protein [Acinetobacter towneri]MCO8065446.1 glucosyltransferase domain-containing protein [Acinetobacter towneri]